MSLPIRSSALEAALFADAVSEVEAAAHQNIADALAGLVNASLFYWSEMPRARRSAEPDDFDMFAGLADVLSDTMEGISSGHLQALYCAREKAQ